MATNEPVDDKKKRFLEAADDGDIDQLRALLSDNPEVKDAQNEELDAALHRCLGHSNCTKLLVKKRANVNIQNKLGRTPLHVAASGDLVESMWQLLIHNADVDGKPPPKESKSFSAWKYPVELAKENGAKASFDLLLFCGAKIPPVWQGLTLEEREKHETILQGYDEKKITFGGLSLESGEDFTTIKNLGIDVKIHGSVQPVQVDFICRRLAVEYEPSGINTSQIQERGHREPKKEEIEEDGELISDVYQYRVDKSAKCDIRVPIHREGDIDLPQKFSDVELMQILHPDEGKTLEKQSASLIARNKVTFNDVPLLTHGEGAIVSLRVIRKYKVDTEHINHDEEQTFQSTVEEDFKVTKPAGALAGANNIAMQVIKVEQKSRESVSDDSGYGSCSNFHSATTSVSGSSGNVQDLQSNSSTVTLEGDITITLPRPDGSQNAVVVKCSQGDNPRDPRDWNATSPDSVNKKTVETRSSTGGFFIVVLVDRIKSSLVQMVRDLYERIMGPKINCHVCLAVRKMTNDSFQFVVRVTLCADEKELAKDANALKQKGFHLQSNFLEDKKFPKRKPYYMYLQMDSGKVIHTGIPIQYSPGNKWHEFQVKSTPNDTKPSGRLRIFKKHMNDKELADPRTEPKYGIYVYFETETPVQHESFPSSRFISNISGELTWDQSFPIGLFLGMPLSQLQDLKFLESSNRSKEVMQYWQQRYHSNDSNKEEELEQLTIAFQQADARHIKGKFLDEILKLDSSSFEYQWLDTFKVGGNIGESKFNFDRLFKDLQVDPFDDKFLYILAKEVPVELTDFLNNIGVNQNKLDEYFGQRCELGFRMKAFHVSHQVGAMIRVNLEHSKKENI